MLISSKEDIFMRKMFETCMKLNATKFRSKDLSEFGHLILMTVSRVPEI